MNIKTTIVLLLLLGVVVLYFVFVEMKNKPTSIDQPDKKDGQALFTAEQLPTESVTLVKVKIGQEPAAVLSKQGTEWWQTEPVRFALSSWSVKDLVDAAGRLRYVEKLTPGGKDAPTLESIQLQPPKATVVLEAKGKDDKTITQTIQVGRQTVGGRTYVRINDDQAVYVVGDDLNRSIFGEGVKGWRSRNLSAPAEGKVQRVRLTQGGRTIDVVKDAAGGSWSFGQPDSGRVDEAAVKSLIGALSSVSIHEFRTDDPKDLSPFGLDNPTTVISVEATGAALGAPPKDNADETAKPDAKPEATKADNPAVKPAATTTWTLRIGAPVDLKEEYYYATWSAGDKVSPVVFDVYKTSTDKFAKKVNDLRDPRITPLKSADVNELTVQQGAQTAFKLDKSAAVGWQYADPKPPYKADQNEAGSLVARITGARAKDYVAGAKPAGEPVATVRLSAVGRSEPDVLKLYEAPPAPADAPADKDKANAADPDKTPEPAGGKRWLALRNNETTGYLVPADPLAGVFEPIWSLRDRQVLSLKPQQATQLTLKRPDGVTYQFTRAAAAKPVEKKPDATNSDAKKPDDKKADGAAAAPPAPAVTPAAPAKWQLVGHEKFESAAFNSLLNTLASLKVAKWLAPDVKVGDEAVEVTIEVADGSPVVVKADLKTRDASAGGVDQPFQISESLAGILDGEFRDRTVLALGAADLKQVAITRGDDSLIITHSDDGKFANPDGKALDEAAVGALFDALAGLRVKRYLPADAAAPAKTIAVTITTRAGAEHKLTLSDDDAVNRHALGVKVFSLDAATLKKLKATLVKKAE